MFAVLDGLRQGKLKREEGAKLIDARLQKQKAIGQKQRKHKPVEKPA
jgi:hypothetical protein